MSGAGKSTLVAELRARGHAAFDADDDGFSEPRGDGRWGWRAARVADLLDRLADGLVFFAGCSDEQADLPFDYRVLLTAPAPVLVERLRARAGNGYGRERGELAQVLGISRRSSRCCVARPTSCSRRRPRGRPSSPIACSPRSATADRAGVREPVPKPRSRANTVPGHGQGNR